MLSVFLKKQRVGKAGEIEIAWCKCTWPLANVTIYIINTKECQKHFKKLVIPFHFMSNIWEWDKKSNNGL